MNFAQKKLKAELEKKLAKKKPQSIKDAWVRFITFTLIWAATLLFPAMTVWYPSAWFMAGISLYGMAGLLIICIGSLWYVADMLESQPPEIQKLQAQLQDDNIYRRGHYNLIPIGLFVVGLWCVGYPIWAVIFGSLFITLRIVGHSFYKQTRQYV